MGGELGSLVASLLEAEAWVGQLCGIDVDPPRRRLRKAEFHRIEPSDRERIVDVVTAFDPHVLIHLAVWEPHARAGTNHARQFTDQATTSIVGAAAECRSLESIVVRSGIEIYGRRKQSLTRPDESVAAHPTSDFGQMVQRVEAVAGEPALEWASPSVRCAWLRCWARTCPARSAGCCVSLRCHSVCWPTRRSRWWKTPMRLARLSQQLSDGWIVR